MAKGSEGQVLPFAPGESATGALTCQFQPLLQFFKALNDSVVAQILLSTDRRMMAQVLHHGCLADFKIANAQFQFTYIILDRADIGSNGPQMFKNETVDVLHAD